MAYHMAMSARTSPNARRYQVGVRLRTYRDNADKTQKVAAEALGCGVDKIIRIERGENSVSRSDLEVLLNLYGVDDPVMRAWLHQTALESRQRGAWWVQFQPPGPMTVYVGFETISTQIETYSNYVLPGLLQHEAYARAVIRANFPHADPPTVQRFINLRLERQKRLTGGELRLWAIIDEPVLSRDFPGALQMREQLDYLLDLSALPNVTIQICPVTPAPPIVRGPFSLLTLDSGDVIVFTENLIGDTVADDADTVRDVRLTFDTLRMASLPREDSRAVIRQAAIGLGGPNGPQRNLEEEYPQRQSGMSGSVPDDGRWRFSAHSSGPGP